MIITLTPLGIHMVFDAKKDEKFYQVLNDQINELLTAKDQTDPEWIDLQNENIQCIINTLYFCDLGYMVSEEFSECVTPKFWVTSENQIVIMIPDPGVVYLNGIEKAYDMLEELVNSEKFPAEEYDSDICMDIYTSILDGEFYGDNDDDDEDEDDEDDDGDDPKDESPEEQKAEEKSPVMQGIAIVSDHDLPKNTSSDQMFLYRLPKASDAYRYKRMAQNFYMFGNGTMYMELKKNRRCMIAGLKSQEVNVRFATKIPASQLD